MRIVLLIFLACGLASSEKLDRSYLPPPGSKYAGGSPGDIQVPLEYPKETYSTGQHQDGKPDIELGINQRPPSPSGVPESQKPGFQTNSYKYPKTTTSYAITQTTTFAPADDYEGLTQPSSVNNGSGIQPGYPGQSYQQQPIRGPGRRPGSNRNRPGQNQASTAAPYGTTARPLFPGSRKGLEYLPPVPASNGRGQSVGQDGFGYQSGKPQGPKYEEGPRLTQGSNAEIQYQDERFRPSGPGSQQFQNKFLESQFPSTTKAPQYQTGQRLTTPGSTQQNQFLANQAFPSTTAAPQFQAGQRFTTPGINQEVFGSRLPNQQNQYDGNQLQGNQNFPSSTAAPTPGFIQQSFPSTATPIHQNGQRITTPGEIQGGFVPGQQSPNQYVQNQNFPTSTTAPEFQDGQSFSSPGYVQQGIGSTVTPIQNKNLYSGNQNFPSSTATPQYQNGQQFTNSGPIRQNQYPDNQNFQSTAAPNYQNRLRFSPPNQLIPGQQSFGSRITNQQSQNQYPGNENYPSSTTSPQYQDNQRLTSGSRLPIQQIQNQYPGNLPSSTVAPQYQDNQRFSTPGARLPAQQTQNIFEGNQNYPSTSAAPQYQDGQRFTTPGSQIPYQQNQNYPSSSVAPQFQDNQRLKTPGTQQIIDTSQQNQYPGSQSLPSSTVAPQFQDQRFSTPGQQGSLNQPNYTGSTSATQTFAPTGVNQPGFIPEQQNQYQPPNYNQQIPSSTGVPQESISGSQVYANDRIQTTPGTAVSFPASQGVPIYGSTQQPSYQTGIGSPIYGTAASVPSGSFNQGFPSTTIGPQPATDYPSAPGFGNVVQSRPERPQAENDRNAEIISYENVLTPEGYSYSYDTSNGIHADETGTVGNGTRAQGGFSYTGDDGKVYSVFYSADENGFQPQGDHLPTSPPIPEAIQRVIDQAIKDKELGIEDDGSYNEEKYGFMQYEGPLTKLPPQTKTMSTINGADLPNLNQNRYGGQKNKVIKSKGRKPSSGKPTGTTNEEELESGAESEYEKTDANEEHDGSEVNLGNKNENVKRISTKRPKPIKNLTVEDNRPSHFRENKIPIKSNVSSKSDSLKNNKPFDQNSSFRRPVSSNDENVTDEVSIDDITDEQKDNEELDNEGSQEIDYDSDLVNYKDDPNNRTDFHGLNRYLPKPKGSNQKNRPGKKRPTAQVNESQKPITEANEADEFDNYQEPQENESDFIDKTQTRVPSRKNKIGQKIKSHSRVTERPVSLESNAEMNLYDEGSGNSEENVSDQNIRPLSDPFDRSRTMQYKKVTLGKPKRPNTNDHTAIYEKENTKTSTDEETGYEYNPPQRKFETGDTLGVSRSPVSGKPKELQTTLRPFMTKNVYGDDIEPADEHIDENGAVKPGHRERPMIGQKQQYPGFNQDGDKYTESQNSNLNDDREFDSTRKPGFGTTASRQPFGGSRTTGAPQYEGQRITDQQRFNEPVSYQGTQRPGEKIFYNTNTSNRGVNGDVFSSTTPLPPSGPESVNHYQRPGQYQGRPTDSSVPNTETSSPTGDAYINRPGANELVLGQVPSTTYRPNYSFGDRTLAPNGPITVDGFGRPIASTNAPNYDRSPSPERPIADKFKPTEGRFGVTSTQETPGYQSSTSAPIGEDFSGPKQPQRFDPESGYYYK